ncbi:DUF3192 domain-containing protein [Glaciecola siphonariae]|uniref:DUF3192 domain-containing protein n=1 Tax=Glaciecola siphonariae TaxID=521012 RepID=A0ABV9LXK4_9ALTE
MSRNMVIGLVIFCVLVGAKGAQLLYSEVTESAAGADALDWEERELVNRQAIQSLRIGDSLLHVTDNMGTADFNEIIPTNDQPIQVVYYRTHRVDGDGVTTKDECTPLVFKDQVLMGWGSEFLASVVD